MRKLKNYNKNDYCRYCKSKNIVNGCIAAKRKKFSKIIKLTGNKKNNPVMKKGDINLWIDSNGYNFIETINQF